MKVCGYGYGPSNDYFVRIVHHRHHIYMVCPLCGYGYGLSNDYFVRIVHHRYHTYNGLFPVWIRMCLQIIIS